MTAEALSVEVEAARGGDRHAFARVVDATRNVVCSVTLAIVRDVEASEDLAQDVFVAAWTALPTLRAPDSFLPWLRQLARNRAHEHLRGRVRWRRRHAGWEADAETAPDRAPLASDRLITEEERRALIEALDALPDEAREVVTLYYREGSSARQVADLLDLSEVAVKKRLERARTALREAVMARFAESVRKTAPGATFTLAVAAGLAAAAPGTASAAALLGGAGAKGKLLAVLLGLGGALAGLVGGLAGIWIGLRLEGRKALDQRERDELRALGVRASLLAGLSVAGMMAGPALARRGHAPLGAAIFAGAYLAFSVGLVLLYGRVLPRILARRHAAERSRDPGAALRQRRQARFRLAGLLFGLACGLAGSALGTWFLLRR